MGKAGRSNDLGSAFHYLSKDVFGLLINFEVVFFIYTSLPKNATFKRNVSKKKRKKGWINSQRLMNFILFLKKRKVCHTRQREREEMQTAINRPQDPHQRHPSTGGKVASRYNQNQRSNTTRLTLF